MNNQHPPACRLIVSPTNGAAAAAAADAVATELRISVASRGAATVAVSGGSTPSLFLRALAQEPLPWPHIHLFQVDERIAPDGDIHRNAVELVNALFEVPLPNANIHLMDVMQDPRVAANAYASLLRRWCPDGLDVVHLGLGEDGHTASLVPGDPVLDVTDRSVAVTGEYQGHRRITLTYPELARSHHVVWLATGAAKSSAVRRLMAHDVGIPAGRVQARDCAVFTDQLGASEAS